jgi:protein associated with RNAse G/E
MISVRAYKYDGSQHRTWDADLIRHEGNLLVLDAKFATEVHHDILGTISRGTLSLEYYWLDRWYNVFRFSQPSGELRNYYCNINVPPTFDGSVLSYVDLDIDILVQENFSYSILDLDEFQRNAELYRYPEQVRHNVQLASQQLVELIEKRSFPFDE